MHFDIREASGCLYSKWPLLEGCPSLNHGQGLIFKALCCQLVAPPQQATRLDQHSLILLAFPKFLA